MKPTMTLLVLLCIANGLTVGLTLAVAHRGQWMGATALLTLSLLLLDRVVRIMRGLRGARS